MSAGESIQKLSVTSFDRVTVLHLLSLFGADWMRAGALLQSLLSVGGKKFNSGGA
jgi:hypothetical protein